MTERPQNKHLKPNPQSLPNVKLGANELSKAVKVRGSHEAVTWFLTLDWQERRQLIEQLHADHGPARS